MGGERVAQLVRSQPGIETGDGQITLQGQLHRPPVELPPPGGNKKRLAFERTRIGEGFQGEKPGGSKRAEPPLPALAQDAPGALVTIALTPPKADQFAQPQP